MPFRIRQMACPSISKVLTAAQGQKLLSRAIEKAPVPSSPCASRSGYSGRAARCGERSFHIDAIAFGEAGGIDVSALLTAIAEQPEPAAQRIDVGEGNLAPSVVRRDAMKNGIDLLFRPSLRIGSRYSQAPFLAVPALELRDPERGF